MIKKTNPAFIIILLVILWINQKYVLQTILYEADFLDRAFRSLGDWGMATDLFPKFIQHNIAHGLFLSLAVIGFYYAIVRLIKKGKWFLTLILIPSVAILAGIAISILDESTFANYTLRFHLVTEEELTFSRYQHLNIRNIIELFSLGMGTLTAILLSKIFSANGIVRQGLKRLPRSFWVSNSLFYLFVFIADILIFQSPRLGVINNVLFTSFILSAALAFLSSIIFIYLDEFKSKRTLLTEHLFKSTIVIIGAATTFLFVETNLFSAFPFGDVFWLVIVSLFQRILFVTLLVIGWTVCMYRFDFFGIRSAIQLEGQVSNLSSELSLLKSQINPHFLFNSLNTVYGLALEEQSPKSAEGIQKLSDMMRFMLQENIAEKILVSQELRYINDYIDFQRLRLDENMPVELDVNISEGCSGEIAPMLMIPLIENAFKHGISNAHKSHISINLICRDHFLSLVVKNTKQKTKQLQSGIGIKNVQKRLAIYYTDCHSFEITDAQDFYEVKLKIEFP